MAAFRKLITLGDCYIELMQREQKSEGPETDPLPDAVLHFTMRGIVENGAYIPPANVSFYVGDHRKLRALANDLAILADYMEQATPKTPAPTRKRK